MTVQGADPTPTSGPEGAPADAAPPTPAAGETCRRCGASLADAVSWERLRICPACRYHGQLPARRRLEILLDEGSFRESHQTLTSVDPLLFSDRVPYSARLEEAREKTGLEEAVVVGTGRINGRECVLCRLRLRASWAAAWAPSSAKRSRWRSSTPSTAACRSSASPPAAAPGCRKACSRWSRWRRRPPPRPACTRPACRSSRS